MITIEEFKNKITKKSRLIGLDLGSKRIGIAICDDQQSIAIPFKTLLKNNFGKLINELKLIIKDNNIKGIIVGNPINMDGSLGPSAQSVKDVCKDILKNIDVPLCLWDERLSSVGAFNLSNQLDINVSKKIKNLDKNAAAFILQGAIDYLKN
jgi:putative Holliday junction resolvase